MNTETAIVLTFIEHADLEKPETEVLDISLACTAAILDPGERVTIDANEITYAFMRRRSTQQDRSVREDEVHDYVRHMLREADHVCRYAVDRGHNYILHSDPQCSDSCASHVNRLKANAPKGDYCPDCFVWVPAAVECDLCH